MLRPLLTILLLLSCSVLSAQELQLHSRYFGTDRKLLIALPEGYHDSVNAEKRYQVAYVFDSQNDYFFRYSASLIQNLNLSGSFEPTIVVGIRSTNRRFEFTPKLLSDGPYKSWSKTGGADSLLLHLESEVFPYIEKKYRTSPVRLGLGHSLGGTFLTWCLTSGRRVFDAHVIISPNYEYDNEQLITRIKGATVSNNTFIYLARGKDDSYETRFAPGIEKAVPLYREKLELQYEVLDVNNHGNTYLTGFINGLVAYHRSVYGKAENTIKHFTALSEKQGYKLDADQINSISYNYFMRPGTWQEAVKIFDWGLKWYPENTNLYDSISEAYEHAGNKTTAIEYCLKGIRNLEAEKGKISAAKYEGQKKYLEGRLAKLKG